MKNFRKIYYKQYNYQKCFENQKNKQKIFPFTDMSIPTKKVRKTYTTDEKTYTV